LTTRTIEQIAADIAATQDEKNRLGSTGPALQEELEAARTDARNAEQIAGQRGWLAVQQAEADRVRLNVEQLRFLVSEADAEIARLTATGDSLNDRVLAGNAAVVAAIKAGDAAAAERNQAAVNDAGQALAKVPGMIAAAQSHKSAAEQELAVAEQELAVAEGYVAIAMAEIERIESLPSGVAWDKPAPRAPREIPSGLGFGGEMIWKQMQEDAQKALEPQFRLVGERQIRPARDPSDRKPKSWKVGRLNKTPR